MPVKGIFFKISAIFTMEFILQTICLYMWFYFNGLGQYYISSISDTLEVL